MKYLFLLIICAVVFLICFLIDLLLKKLFPKEAIEKGKQVVRLPRRGAIFGVILAFTALVVFVRILPQKMDTLLFVGEESLQLYSAMQGLDSFLNKAFFRWCAVKGIDPDSVENNPAMLTYFPDPEGE